MDKHCVPLADPAGHPEAFFAGLRVVAVDGSNFELPDEAANVEAFGYPGSRTGRRATRRLSAQYSSNAPHTPFSGHVWVLIAQRSSGYAK